MTAENKVKVFARPMAEREVAARTCPGCGHAITWRLVAEAIDELGILDRTVCCAGIGCHSFFIGSGLFNFDQIWALHGRAPAVATGVRRVRTEPWSFASSDGDRVEARGYVFTSKPFLV